MQTRKRAKSITFGKPKKEEEEVKTKAAEEEKVAAPVEPKEEAPKKVEEPKETPETPESTEPTEAAKKIIALEENDKELSSELSATPVATEEEPVLSDKPETPAEKDKEEDIIAADNFVIDTEATKVVDDKPEEETKETESKEADTEVLSPIVETETKTETSDLSSPSTQELSDTPPASAFSIQDDNASDDSGGKKRHFLVYFLVIALFSFILGLGAMAVISSGILPGVSLPKELPFASEIGKSVQQTVSQPTVAPTVAVASPTVAPTEKPVDLSAYTVSVLNGSGIKGKAAEVKTSLTTAGFKVGTTGNAANSNFTSTEISAKKDVDQGYIDKLKAELEKDFVVKVSSAPAPASQATDVVITIGSDTAN